MNIFLTQSRKVAKSQSFLKGVEQIISLEFLLYFEIGIEDKMFSLMKVKKIPLRPCAFAPLR